MRETQGPGDPAVVFDAYPKSPITVDDLAIYRGRLERRLRVQRCGACRRWHAPARALCPSCWSTDVTAEEVSGRGTIDLLVTLRQGPAVVGIDYEHGHVLASVSIDEQPGVRVTGPVVDREPSDVRIGMRVRTTWIERGGGPLPAFVIDDEAGS